LVLHEQKWWAREVGWYTQRVKTAWPFWAGCENPSVGAFFKFLSANEPTKQSFYLVGLPSSVQGQFNLLAY